MWRIHTFLYTCIQQIWANEHLSRTKMSPFPFVARPTAYKCVCLVHLCFCCSCLMQWWCWCVYRICVRAAAIMWLKIHVLRKFMSQSNHFRRQLHLFVGVSICRLPVIVFNFTRWNGQFSIQYMGLSMCVCVCVDDYCRLRFAIVRLWRLISTFLYIFKAFNFPISILIQHSDCLLWLFTGIRTPYWSYVHPN